VRSIVGMLSCLQLRLFSRSSFLSFNQRSYVWATWSLLVLSAAAYAGSPAVTLSPTSLTFATQTRSTTSPAQTITLTNTGTASLAITSIKASASFSESNNCKTSVAAGASCTISVAFTPGTNGTVNGTITITDSATGSPQTVALTGTGTIASLSPSSVNFGNQSVGSTSPAQVVTMTNVGLAVLHVSAVTIQGANPSDFLQTNNCGAVAASGACAINVSFAPAATGTFTGTVNVSLSSGAVSPIPTTLTGTGTNSAPTITLAPSSLNFSNQGLQTISAVQNVTLTNTAATAVSITSVAIGGTNAGDFLQSNTCGSSVAGGAICIISVQFQPTALGARSGSLSITDNATGSPQTVALSGTGANPVPSLQQPLTPLSATPGSAAPTLTVNGTGFISSSSVLWNGSNRVTTFISAQKLQAALLSSDIANVGTAQVLVTNPAPGGGSSNPQPFQITNPSSTVAMNGSALAVGMNPRGISVSDFDGNGKPDIAVVNRASNTVSIQLGNGDGTFAAAAPYATGVDPIAIAVGDFNGDGKLDLVTANRASYTISVLLGNGDGTFGNHTDYAAGTEPLAIAVGDFNGDGFLDVVEANSADNTISIYLGVGNGTLQLPVTYSVGADPIAIVTGDFN